LTPVISFYLLHVTAEEAAARAVKELNGLEVMGREMRADFAVKKDNSFSRPRDGAGDW
jgi:RNA recognition motif-containing protein